MVLSKPFFPLLIILTMIMGESIHWLRMKNVQSRLKELLENIAPTI